ncbi:MAG: hypothetical protein IPM39_15175 [Chloroflexi bacterium]|nr:hypothetical protein [Chloroflexota bacterium]
MNNCTICAIITFCLLALAACSPRPEPLPPAPLPTVEAVQEDVPEYVAWLPVVVLPEPVRGLAYCCGALRPGEAARLGIEIWYNYGLNTPGRTLDNGAIYVPMFWCDKYPALKYPTQVDYFQLLRHNLPPGYTGPLLFLNEPDLAGRDVDMGQCDRTPRQAAYIYKGILELCPGCRLIGPAVSHEDYLADWPWMRAWYDEIYKLKLRPPDTAAIHTYLNEPPHLIINSLFDLLAAYPGAPTTAWITEFASCNPSQAARMIAYYERSDRVEKYFWFTGRGWPDACINLLSDDGRLTAAGEVYSGRGAPNAAPAAYP